MQRAAARISRSTSPRHRLSALLACSDIPMSSQLFDTLASRFSSPKINIEIPVERNLRVESLRVRILRFFSDDSRTKRCTYALSLSLSLFSFLSLLRITGLRVKTHATVPCSISHPPPSRRRANHHPNRCRAVCVCTSGAA